MLPFLDWDNPKLLKFLRNDPLWCCMIATARDTEELAIALSREYHSADIASHLSEWAIFLFKDYQSNQFAFDTQYIKSNLGKFFDGMYPTDFTNQSDTTTQTLFRVLGCLLTWPDGKTAFTIPEKRGWILLAYFAYNFAILKSP